MKVRIEDFYDGFAIVLIDGDKEDRYHIDQEDNRYKLVGIFEDLGFEVEYEECC